MTKLSILILAFALLASACSIQKRKYLPGYSIEWFSKEEKQVVKILDKTTVKGEQIKSIANHYERNHYLTNTLSTAADSAIVPLFERPSFSKTPVATYQEKTNAAVNGNSSRISKRNIKAYATSLQEKPTLNILAIIGAITGILALGALVVSGLVYLSPLVPVLLMVGGFTFSLIALLQFEKNPGKYEGKGYAITGLALSGAAIISVLIAMILVFFNYLID
jgi:hypothetical protein